MVNKMPRYVINDELHGVELYFESVPTETTRDLLKNNRWRWNRSKKCWYNKKTDTTIKFAQEICNTVKSSSVKATPKRTVNRSIDKSGSKNSKNDPVQTNKWLDNILERIRNNDSFNEFDKDYSSNLVLMDHQKAGAIIAEKYKRFAFFYDTGTGKTVMTLNIIAEKYRSDNVRFLIIAPKPLIKNAWLEDARNYFPDMRILPLSTNITFDDYKTLYNRWKSVNGGIYDWEEEYGDYKNTELIKKKLLIRAQHYIINIDQIRSKEKAEELIRKTGVTGIIIDESSILKNYESKSSQRIRVISKGMDYVYLLSGKPAPNSPLEYYSQMKIVDPETFNMGFDAFKERFFMQRGRYKYVLKNQYSERDVTRMVGQRSIIVRKEECLDLPENTSVKRQVELDRKTRMLYSRVLNNFITEIISMDGQVTTTKHMGKLARIAKLRELSCGFFLDENEKYYVSDEKNDALISLLEDEIGTEEQVIIWCNFQFEIETIEKELKARRHSVVTAYGKSKNLDDNIQSFKNGSAQYMIAHPKTLKYGVTFTNCHYAVYNSLSYSLEDYYQSHDRIYRKGQGKKCFFYHLLTRDTIDGLIYNNLNDKHMTAKVFEDLIKKSSKFGVDKILAEKAIRIKPRTKEQAIARINTE